MTHLDPVLASAALPSPLACNAERRDQQQPTPKSPAEPGRRRPTMATGRPSSAKTPEGGFVMGNPNAKVKLIEFGSLTCPHCAEFEEQAASR